MMSGAYSLLDTESGEVEDGFGAKESKCVGNFCIVDGQAVALYYECGCHLQLGSRKWNFADSSLDLSYFHDQNRVTNFIVSKDGESYCFKYRCWWAESETEDFRLFPELDEENDFLGYVMEVWRNQRLKERLFAQWKNASET